MESMEFLWKDRKRRMRATELLGKDGPRSSMTGTGLTSARMKMIATQSTKNLH